MSNNLRLFADATIEGGTYENINAFGSLTVKGDVNAENIQVFGSGSFHGQCQIKTLKILGDSKFNDIVEINNLDLKGECYFEKNAKVDHMKIYGSAEFKENVLNGKEVKIFGAVNVNILEAEDIFVKGYIKCLGQLNGENIEIITNNSSKIKEIVGTKITVKPSKRLFLNSSNKVSIETIEGDDIYLENVNAKAVRGNKVVIGPNCKIDLVEYHENYEEKEKGSVNKVEKY